MTKYIVYLLTQLHWSVCVILVCKLHWNDIKMISSNNDSLAKVTNAHLKTGK